MSTRKLIIAALNSGVPATYDALLVATGATRHNLSNALHTICNEGVVEKIPATFQISESGRERLKQLAKEKAAAARQSRLDDAARRRDNRRRARNAMLAVPDKLHQHVPNSVFDLGRLLEVAA